MKYCIPAALLALMLVAVSLNGQPVNDDPFATFTRHWRDDAIWHDGNAEYATYDAIRSINDQPRRFVASIITNKELADPDTKTKSAGDRGREVFKHHLREDVPTENYTCHYSTMVYLGSQDLKSLKIDMGSQEDCGASFKQYVNHAGMLHWHQFSYFPNEGHRTGSYAPSKKLAYHDGLSLLLRGYPFDEPREIHIDLLPDQTSNRFSLDEPVPAVVRYIGRETIETPLGKIETHHLRVSETHDRSGGMTQDYWFAVDGGPQWLHLLVQYRDDRGTSYVLRDVKRWAYWKH